MKTVVSVTYIVTDFFVKKIKSNYAGAADEDWEGYGGGMIRLFLQLFYKIFYTNNINFWKINCFQDVEMSIL